MTVRVLVVVVLAWLIDATLGTSQPAPVLYMLAFLAGIVPNTVLHFVAEKVLGRRAGAFNRDRLQLLTTLDGIDLYERTRLSEEGITSVEALAHHDLLDLFFKTRIAAARLVDWTDQAILAMYLGGEDEAGELRDALRRAGVRTATDLVEATRRNGAGDAAEAVASEAHTRNHLVPALGLAHTEGESADLARRLCLISAAMDRSEWIGRIEHWRHSDLIDAEDAERSYIDVDGNLRRTDPRTCQDGACP